MQKIVSIDTNVLLNESFDFEDYDKVYIPITCIEELDGLKKNSEIGYLARKATNKIKKAVNVEIKLNYENGIDITYLEHKADNIILCFANEFYQIDNNCIFITDDYNLYLKAKAINIPCELYSKKDINTDNIYKGFKKVYMSEIELANWYELEVKVNNWDLKINQYLLIKSKEENRIVDCWVWTDKGFRHTATKKIDSVALGKVKAMDDYQICAIDSLSNNAVTMIKGKAGTGKSLLAISYAMSMIEKGKLDKIIVFTNPVATKSSAKLGYYPGSKDEKLLDSQCGNMLSSKFGDKYVLPQMISQNKLQILPFSDIRGFDTSGMRALIWIIEAQNLDIELMKLAIQRVGDDCQLVIDGDYTAQVDSREFEGNQNGMKRVSEVFTGMDFYGEVELQKIYRSKWAEYAELL